VTLYVLYFGSAIVFLVLLAAVSCDWIFCLALRATRNCSAYKQRVQQRHSCIQCLPHGGSGSGPIKVQQEMVIRWTDPPERPHYYA
jgi:hypothetical protein